MVVGSGFATGQVPAETPTEVDTDEDIDEDVDEDVVEDVVEDLVEDVVEDVVEDDVEDVVEDVGNDVDDDAEDATGGLYGSHESASNLLTSPVCPSPILHSKRLASLSTVARKARPCNKLSQPWLGLATLVHVLIEFQRVSASRHWSSWKTCKCIQLTLTLGHKCRHMKI